MKAVLLFLAMVTTPTALIFAWVWADSLLEERAEARRRAQQDRETTPEWLAVLAATDTPIFAEVWAESLRRDLKEL